MSGKPTYEELEQSLKGLLAELERKTVENSQLRRSVLSTISHEIRTPMHAIMGFVQLLAKADLNSEEREEYLLLVEQSGQYLLSVIDTMIDASLLDSGELKLYKSDCNLHELLQRVYHHFGIEKRKMERYSVALLKSIDLHGKDISIKADTDRLEQVLSHLLTNALAHTHKGIIEFGCSLVDGRAIRFFVTDSGGKYASRELDVLYGRQVGKESTGLQNNTSFRLNIVRELVKLMDGEIWVEDNGYSGATVCFSIPVLSSSGSAGSYSGLGRMQDEQPLSDASLEF
ncbi:MAG: HAMP domain-containing sensor histidine kinase [Bacteroidales bacterium]